MDIIKTADKFFRPWQKDKPDALPIRQLCGVEFKGTPKDAYTWNDFDADCKSKWPIRFFLFHDIPIEISFMWNRYVIDIIWKFKHKFIPKHKYHIVETDLKPGYHDPAEQMLYSWMKMVTDFIDNTNDVIEWEENEFHKKTYDELLKVYEWWKDYPYRIKQIDESYDDMDNIVEMEFYGKKCKLHISNKLEQELDNEAEKMLCVLAKYRTQLWYP
jgi:hypothetical protein